VAGVAADVGTTVAHARTLPTYTPGTVAASLVGPTALYDAN